MTIAIADAPALIAPEKSQFLRDYWENLPKHHKDSPTLLCNTLIEGRRVAPHLNDLAYSLFRVMPRMVMGSQNVRSISRNKSTELYPLDKAITNPWFSVNNKWYTNCIILDIDHGDALSIYFELPEKIRPHLVFDTNSGRCHAIFQLATPVCHGRRARLAPQMLELIATRLLAERFKATALAPTAVIKSPWALRSHLIGAIEKKPSHNSAAPFLQDAREQLIANEQLNPDLIWHTVPGRSNIQLQHILNELLEDEEEEEEEEEGGDRSKGSRSKGTTFRRRVKKYPNTALGRNCALFDCVRYQAYAGYITDDSELIRLAEEVNRTFTTPLPIAEIHDTARSIGKFMRDRYCGGIGGDRRGIMDLDPETPVVDRLKAGAQYTNELRSTRMDLALISTLDNWDRQEKVTQKRVAELAGVSVKTVKRKWAALVKKYNIKNKMIQA